MANGYSCQWKTVDRSISQHNRILVGTPNVEAAKRDGNAPLFTDQEMANMKNRYFDFHGKARVAASS